MTTPDRLTEIRDRAEKPPIARCHFSRNGEQCELQVYHGYPKHQVHIANGDFRPVIDWPVTEYDTSHPTIAQREELRQQVARLSQQLTELEQQIKALHRWTTHDLDDQGQEIEYESVRLTDVLSLLSQEPGR